MATTKTARTIIVLLLAAALSACQTTGGQKETGGTLLGAGLGALAGSQIGSGRGQLAAVAIGALGGALLGNSVGRSLDRADRIHADRAAQAAHSASIGEPVAWRNPDSGNSGSVTPVREGRDRASGSFRGLFDGLPAVNIGLIVSRSTFDTVPTRTCQEYASKGSDKKS